MDDMAGQIKLLQGLAETTNPNDWADDILSKCRMMREAIRKIEMIAERRLPGER